MPVLQRFLPLLIALSLLTACAGAATPAPLKPTATPPTAGTSTAPPLAAPTATGAASASTSAPATRTSPAATATGAASPASAPAARVTATSPARPANATPNAPNISPTAGEALIEQAIGYLLDHYVDPLSSSDLYRAAYDGAVATLHASSKMPTQLAPTLTGDRKADAAAFKSAYLALAGGVGADINQTILAYEAIRAVAGRIDECHTAFLDPAQYRSVTAGLSGTDTFGGIGVSIRAQTRPVTIGDIFPNTPAAASGLRRGDAFIKVLDTDVSDLSAEAISALVRGEVGTPVTLTVQRPGEAAPLTFTLVRAAITVPVFVTDILPGPNGTRVGYMKLYTFATNTDKQVQDALDRFEGEGVTGWVLDLRDNGGGYIDILAKIASRFARGEQPVAYRTERGKGEEVIATDPTLYSTPQRPFAILINGGSASASEALASAAQDDGFARLFGQTTAGCLAGATTYRLADGSALQVTIWKIVSPQRREINRVGQRPDEAIPPDPTGATDPVLDAAIRWLATQRGQ